MTMQEIARQLVDLCRQGQNLEAIQRFYAQDVTSAEAIDCPEAPQIKRGLQTVVEKNKWWLDNHEVHSAQISDPMYHGNDRFGCVMNYDVTNKVNGRRMKIDELAIYTVQGDKIVKEEFFYDMGKVG